MSRKVVTMEQKLAAVFAEVACGRATVTQVCAELGISRDSYYRYRRRFTTQGLAGLQLRSRAPKSSPTRTGEAMSELIAAARQQLHREGWDNGAWSIHARLRHDGVNDVPSARTIHRVLHRHGLITPQPRKRPRSSYRRFVFPATDDCWQIDAFEHTLADPPASPVVVFEILDDHSRYHVDALAWPQETTEGAWTAMTRAIGRYGTPRMVLSDNGLAFTGRRVNSQVLFEKNLARLGVKLINSRPGHPQTNGKNERAHATAQRWLAAQPPAATLHDLQALLERYRNAYNRRPHQGIDHHTPLQQRLAGTRPTPPVPTDRVPTDQVPTDQVPTDQAPTDAVSARPRPHTQVFEARATSRDGYLCLQNTIIPLGTEYAELPLTAFITGDHALILYREQLVRELIIDRARKRQPPARPRTGTRRSLTYNPQP